MVIKTKSGVLAMEDCITRGLIVNHAKKSMLICIICVLASGKVTGEIRNGYENQIHKVNESLNNLNALLTSDQNLSSSQRRRIESRMLMLVNTISYYDLTENLLDQFRLIAPALYNEIDTITDKNGRSVSVYVKFVPCDATEVKAWGTTSLSQSENDEDAYHSEYGEHTVSVKIWVVSNALLVLAHELGHVKYQVRNLATYVEYYKKHYYGMINWSNYIGHDETDLSGKSALTFEKIFRKEYVHFLRMTPGTVTSPLVLMQMIKRNLGIARLNL